MKRYSPFLNWITTLIVPFFLVMTAICFMLNPFFLRIEYRRPGFPSDPYGFTFEERLKWSLMSLDYLTNDADISFLGDLNLPDGSLLFNERELSHMVDVKLIVQKLIPTWYVITFILLVFGFWAWLEKSSQDYWSSLSRGGWLTIGFIFLIFVVVATSFNTLFTTFHRVFFEGDTWLFRFSDTLIRLFPLCFWQDIFVTIGIFSLFEALLIIFLSHTLSTKKTR